MRVTSVKATILVALILSPALWPADSPLVFSRTLGGSTGPSIINTIATDPAGNIIAAGTTSAFDFPVTNGSSNSGTQIAESFDSGNTWKPLGNLPSGSAYLLALDASTPPLLFAGGTGGLFRSGDGGKSWSATSAFVSLNCTAVSPFCGVIALAADPVYPRILYAGGAFGIFKTMDGGASWQPLLTGSLLPAGSAVYYISIDPFQPAVIYAGAGSGPGSMDFRSFDGGKSWSQYSVPNNNPGYYSGSSVSFDPFTAGRIYHAGPQGMYVSADGGQTWTQPASLTIPLESAAASRAVAGAVYAFNWNGKFYGSTDYGATWNLISSRGYTSSQITLDPFQPLDIFAGNVSTDGGMTWAPQPLGRPANQILFDPHTPGHLWAATNPTSDAFVAKLDPTGKQILLATYFGGSGNETVSHVALDAVGNIYIMGITSAVSFPATPGAALSTWSAANGAPTYVAKFDPNGDLVYATFVNHPGIGFAVSSDGSAVITGFQCSVQKLSPDGSRFLFSETVGDGTALCGAAVAADGTTVVGGRQVSKALPVTPNALQAVPIGSQDAVLARLGASGNVLYATYLGGPAPAGPYFDGIGTSQISAITLDAHGNIVLAGSTGASFPVTPGAYQTTLDAHCPYPSSEVATGFIGTIITRRMDDVFVTTLDPSGTTILSSTLFGGACYDQVDSIDVDANGNVWLAGLTDSNPFPQVAPFATGPANIDYRGYVAEFDASLATLLLSSYISAGGSPVVAVDRAGGAWVAGTTVPPPPVFTYPSPPAQVMSGAGLLAHIGPAPPNPLVITGAGNSYSGRDGPIAPGELATITLAGFQPDQIADLGYAVPLPTALAGAQVLFDGEPAVLAGVYPGRIYCVTPYDLAGRTSTKIEVTFDGQVSTSLTADVLPVDLGLLSADGSGQGQAYARNADGTLNSSDNPAKSGSLVTFYATGLGTPGSSCPYGQPASGNFTPQQPVGSNFSGMTQVSSLAGFVCGIYSVQTPAPTVQSAVPNLFFFAPGSSNQMLTIAVAP
jgi:uncharacterized protein (TIGR03437 family)